MSSLPQKEGYTNYLPHVKCHHFLCWRKPIYKKLVVKFPAIVRYLPTCEKHI